MLAEGTQRIVPTAYVHIQSKYVNGRVPAVCLPGCVTQSIMGYEYILQENGTKTENSDICVITMWQQTCSTRATAPDVDIGDNTQEYA